VEYMRPALHTCDAKRCECGLGYRLDQVTAWAAAFVIVNPRPQVRYTSNRLLLLQPLIRRRTLAVVRTCVL